MSERIPAFAANRTSCTCGCGQDHVTFKQHISMKKAIWIILLFGIALGVSQYTKYRGESKSDKDNERAWDLHLSGALNAAELLRSKDVAPVELRQALSDAQNLLRAQSTSGSSPHVPRPPDDYDCRLYTAARDAAKKAGRKSIEKACDELRNGVACPPDHNRDLKEMEREINELPKG